MLPIYLRGCFVALGFVLCLLLCLGDVLPALSCLRGFGWLFYVVVGMFVVLRCFSCLLAQTVGLMLLIAWWLSWCFTFRVLCGFCGVYCLWIEYFEFWCLI